MALGVVGRGDHLFPPDRLRRWLAGNLPVDLLEETVVPTQVVTTDRASGEPLFLGEGPALPAVGRSSPFDFRGTDRLITEADRLTRQWLAERDRRTA